MERVYQTFTNPTDNTLSVYASLWFSGSEIESGTTYETRYRYRYSSSCHTGSPGPRSLIADGATSDRETGVARVDQRRPLRERRSSPGRIGARAGFNGRISMAPAWKTSSPAPTGLWIHGDWWWGRFVGTSVAVVERPRRPVALLRVPLRTVRPRWKVPYTESE